MRIAKTKKRKTKAKASNLPRVAEGQILRLETIRPDQHFTEPPPRYTEATLVKELEEKGIGRPSTYASIISTIVEREYVSKDQGRFTPTMLGERVSALLVKSFEDIFDVAFTARLEEELDEIEEGKLPWRDAVKEFWDQFVVDLDKADDEMLSYKAGIPTGQKCEKCGEGELLERISRHGFFLGCSRYPDCDFIQDLGAGASGRCRKRKPNIATIAARKWSSSAAASARSWRAPAIRIARRRGGSWKARATRGSPTNRSKKSARCARITWSRSTDASANSSAAPDYPKCKYTRPITLGIKCPKCSEGEFVRRGSMGKGGRGRPRVFYGCSRYPDCDFTTPHMPMPEPCPKCGAPFIVEKKSKIGIVHTCLKEGCDWEQLAPEPQPAAVPVPVEEPTPVGAKL